MLLSRNLILQGFLKSGSKSCKLEVTFAIHRIRGSLAEPSVLVGDFRIGVRKSIVPNHYIWYNKIVEFYDGGIPHGHLV